MKSLSLPLQVRLLPLFKDLNDGSFEALSKSCVFKSLARGDSLCNKGDASNGLFVLIRGQLQVYEVSRDGQEVGLNFLNGPIVFGELGVIDGAPRSADIIALTASEVAIVPKPVLIHTFTQAPEAAFAMLRHLTGMVRRLTQHQSVLAMSSATQRVCAMLIELSSRNPAGVTREFDLPKQKDLASMVNTTRETVSRTLGQLLAQGVIKKSKGRLLILDMEILRELAGLH
jgi:CRP/FNR family transcriptional regulator, cyclic AMP receptor protein